MKPGRCVCAWCGHIIDSSFALRLVRWGGVPLCDEVCTEAYNSMLDEKVVREVGDALETLA